MSIWLKIVIAFLALMVIKIITNAIQYYKCTYYEDMYFKTFMPESKIYIREYIPMIRRLFKSANVEDIILPVHEMVGYGMMQSNQASAVANIDSHREDFVHAATHMFAEAKGTFKMRIFDSLSPLYWVNLVLFLPKNILVYLGLKADTVIIKFLQLIWWIVTPFAIIFRQHIAEYISSLIAK